MFSSTSPHSIIARWAIAGMVLTAFIAIAPAATAVSSPIGASSYGFNRTAHGNSVTFRAGEEGQIISQARVSDEYSGWPVANKSIFTRTAFSLKNPDAGILPDYPLEVDRYWWGVNWSDEENPCDGLEEYTTTLTMTPSTTCINNLSIRDSYYLQNETDGPLAVDTNFSTQVVKIGKKGKKAKTIAETDGLTNTLYGSFAVYNETSVVLTEDDSSLWTDFVVCIDESLVETGDVLAIDYGLSHGSTPITSENFYLYDWNGLDYGTWDLSNEDAVTFEIVDKPDENLILGLSLVMQDDVNYEDTTESGTYSGTVDVLNTDAGNVSVTEPCASNNEPSWPTMSINRGPAGSPTVTQDDSEWNASAMTPGDDFYQYGTSPDGFGGLYYWESPDAGDNTAAIAHLGPTGADNSFNGTGTRIATTGADGYFNVSSYGVDGANYATLALTTPKEWTLTTGSKASSVNTPYTVTTKSLTKLCPTKTSAGYVFSITASTASPMAYLYCSGKSLTHMAMIKFDAGVPKLVTRLGAPTASRPCVVLSEGEDTRASGNETALIVYTRTSSLDSNGYCLASGSTVSKRAVTTISAAGVAVTTNLNSNPWLATDGEPDSLQIVAGHDKGTWIGLTGYADENPWDPFLPGNLVTIEGATPTISAGADIVLDDSLDTGSQYSNLAPVMESSISGDQWLVTGTAIAEFDGERSYNSSVGTIDTSTGEIVWGDIVKASGFGYYPAARVSGQFSGASDEIPTLYFVTGYDNPNYEYTAYSWSNAIN